MTDAISHIECVLAHPIEQEICVMADELVPKAGKDTESEARSDPHSPAPPPPPPPSGK